MSRRILFLLPLIVVLAACSSGQTPTISNSAGPVVDDDATENARDASQYQAENAAPSIHSLRANGDTIPIGPQPQPMPPSFPAFNQNE
jgi:hypothetical protein